MNHYSLTRRSFLMNSAIALSSGVIHLGQAQDKGMRPEKADGVEVVLPRGRVPVSFIIDDSTCLVNLAHFCIPQFAEVFPDRYQQPWHTLPREIPDSFVRKFMDWCREHGVKGKYSIVPYPACVGWVDREMPGWSRRALLDSIRLVQEEVMPDWDIHPEMVTHTWVINPRTGRPFEERSERFMENWRWTDGKSVDELATYMTYALGILKNAGLHCDGITTPGGFGNRVLPELAQATLESCRSVFQAPIPHYFRHLFTDEQSVAPRVEYASGLDSDDPRCVVSIIGCTGDWFGGWDGLTPGSVDLLIGADGSSGRLPEVIARGEPAVMVCHWPGIFFNGEEVGFKIFQEAVRRLEQFYPDVLWMKLSEISRYWAAKELTSIRRNGKQVEFFAPFESSDFTVRFPVNREEIGERIRIRCRQNSAEETDLREVRNVRELREGSYWLEGNEITVCFALSRGRNELFLG